MDLIPRKVIICIENNSLFQGIEVAVAINNFTLPKTLESCHQSEQSVLNWMDQLFDSPEHKAVVPMAIGCWVTRDAEVRPWTLEGELGVLILPGCNSSKGQVVAAFEQRKKPLLMLGKPWKARWNSASRSDQNCSTTRTFGERTFYCKCIIMNRERAELFDC